MREINSEYINFVDRNGKLSSDSWIDGERIEKPDVNGLRIVYMPNYYSWGSPCNLLKKDNRLVSKIWLRYILNVNGYSDDMDISYTDENGLIKVQNLEGLWNFMNMDGEFISNRWFKQVKKFVNGFSIVKNKDDKRNYINTDGKLIMNKWIQNVDNFSQNGFAIIENGNGKLNLINSQGEILSDKWFEEIHREQEGFFVVINRLSSGKSVYNFIDETGKLLSEEWFEYAGDFIYGVALVQRKTDRLYNFINKNGDMISEEWFLLAYDDGNKDYVRVENTNGLWNFLNRKTGEPKYKTWKRRFE